MQSPFHSLAGVALASIAALSTSSSVGAQEAPPVPTPIFFSSAATPRVSYDEPGDGNLWARGTRYKACFGADGARYVASFGPNWPSSAPHVLSPDSVTSGGERLVFDADARPTRDGDRIAFDRRAFREVYELAPDSMEQLFQFDALPSRADLVLNIPIASDLECVETDRGLEFRGEHGHIAYSRAIAIDARGRRAVAATHVEDGAITIRVEADFLETATLPLVIDPVVSTVHFDSTTSDTLLPDVCWNGPGLYWFVAYQYVFSATDNDIYGVTLSTSGTTLTTGWVDSSSNSWSAPRCAANWGNNQVLVVAERPTLVPKGVWGRTVVVSGVVFSLGTPFDIGGTSPGDKTAPDVGGDPFAGTASYYCVAWQHVIATDDSNVGYAVVNASSQLVTGPTYFAHQSATSDAAPSVAKLNGATTWLIAWQHADPFSITRTDIHGARVNWSGSLTNDTFPIASGIVFEFAPSVSSPLTGTNQCLVVFTRRQIAAQSDIGAVLVDGATPGASVNLTTLETGPSAMVDQLNASVDSDGSHFVVAYSEYVPAFLYHDVYAAEVFVSGTELRVLQGHEFVYNVSLSALHGQIAGTSGTGSPTNRYFVAFDILQNSTDRDVSGAFFDGVAVGTAQPFCFGDGSSVTCPCGNNGGAKRGCGNASFSSGAQLTKVTGATNVSSDTVVLQVGNVPVSAVCLFFQGTTQTAHNTFGDGLRCTGGTIVRLGIETATGVFASYPGAPGDLPVSQKGLLPAAGGSRAYQVWYRDSSPSYCTASTFNTSNGVMIHWLP